MSDTPTPRTDGQPLILLFGDRVVKFKFAQQLERELAEAKASYALAHSELGSYVMLLAEMTAFRDLLANKEMELLKQLTAHKAALEKCERALNESLSVHGWPHAHIDEALSEIAKLKGNQ